jgi:hypothetical protein
MDKVKKFANENQYIAAGFIGGFFVGIGMS